MRPTLKDFKMATEECRLHNATIAFSYSGEGSEISCIDRDIIIDLNEATTKEWFWSLVFHELAHLECYDKGIYKTYHHDTLSGENMYGYVKKMALKVERYVDSLGEKNMKTLFPDLHFERSYNSMEDVKWLNDWIEETYGN